MKYKFDKNYKNSAAKYLEKNGEAVINDDPGKAAKALKQVAACPGDCQPGGTFQLSSHLQENLTIEESIEWLVEHFSAISQEFLLLDVKKHPDYVKESMTDKITAKPILSEFDVWAKLKEMKKPKSSVPGDFPHKLRKMVELVKHITKIFKNIIKTGVSQINGKFNMVQLFQQIMKNL